MYFLHSYNVDVVFTLSYMKLRIDSGLTLICWMGWGQPSVAGIGIIRSGGRKLTLIELSIWCVIWQALLGLLVWYLVMYMSLQLIG